MKYNPALDGLRGIAVLQVLLMHCGVPGFRGGHVGVDVFFVLSGYLITSLMVREHRETGTIAIGSFYWRRALRLYPALLLFLAVYLLVSPLVWPANDNVTAAWIAGLYLTDYAWPHIEAVKYIRHTWSLAVEEQFYLVWPLLMPWGLSRFNLPRLLRLMLWAYFVLCAWRVGNELAGYPAYLRADTRIAGMVAGACLALAKPEWLESLPAKALALSGAWLLLLVQLAAIPTQAPVLAMMMGEAGAVAVIIGAAQLPLNRPRLVYLGKLSYGVYLWHFPMVSRLNDSLPWWLVTAIVLPASILAAWISFNTVEALARRLRSRHHVLDVAPAQDSGAATSRSSVSVP